MRIQRVFHVRRAYLREKGEHTKRWAVRTTVSFSRSFFRSFSRVRFGFALVLDQCDSRRVWDLSPNFDAPRDLAESLQRAAAGAKNTIKKHVPPSRDESTARTTSRACR